ncbi:unnamed protein product [Discosporangium mesarthrocarpum]
MLLLWKTMGRDLKKTKNRLTITRKRLSPMPSEADWLDCRDPLTPFSVVYGQRGGAGGGVGGVKAIEDSSGSLQLDFANECIGGGVLGAGCCQEVREETWG